jgi:predicted outer membrane repeat protein
LFAFRNSKQEDLTSLISACMARFLAWPTNVQISSLFVQPLLPRCPSILLHSDEQPTTEGRMKRAMVCIAALAVFPFFGNDHSFGQFVWTKAAGNSVLATMRRVPSQYPTIQSAINASNNGDTVLVSDSTYYENIRFMGKRIVVASTYLTTRDTSHISRTVIDGGGSALGDSASVVYFVSGEDTNSVLCGFTVRGGKGTSAMGFRAGGGVLCVSGARLVRNIITGNTLSGGQLWGGGVEAENGQMLIMEQNIVAGNTLSGNWAGGAGVMVYNMKAIIRNNTIVDNTVTTQGTGSGCFGGGIHCEVGSFTIEGNLIARNSALAPEASFPSYGGGVLVRGGSLDFRNNRIVENIVQSSGSIGAYGGGLSLLAAAASELTEIVVTGNYFASNTVIGGSSGVLLSGGGGIFSRDQRPRIENNIIVKNTAPYGSGFGAEKYYTASTSAINALHREGMFTRARQEIVEEISTHPGVTLDAPVLINNTIAYNRATVNGGAIATSGAWTPTIMNTIAWGDTGTQEIYLASGGSIDVQYSDVQGGFAGTGNINAAPLFVSGDSLFHLQPASPCIGRGIDSLQIGGVWYRAPAWDYDGHQRHRPTGAQSPDIGAQEEQVTVDVASRVSVPLSYMLIQNYPNPFNPTTVVGYQLPVAGSVTLAVYDMLGREVAMLVNERKGPGSYTVEFHAAGLASGVYICRMNAGGFTESRRMLLLR